jgi:hypothetical protein
MRNGRVSSIKTETVGMRCTCRFDIRGSHLPQFKGSVVKTADEAASRSLSAVPEVDPVTAGQADVRALRNEDAASRLFELFKATGKLRQDMNIMRQLSSRGAGCDYLWVYKSECVSQLQYFNTMLRCFPINGSPFKVHFKP